MLKKCSKFSIINLEKCTMNNMKYFIKTYGCQMNVHESEKLAGMLRSLGYEETSKMDDADVIVFNTCCIRDGCEQKVFGNLGNLKRLKKANPNLITAICGCLTQAEGRKDYIKEKFPYVNIVFGTHNITEFKNYILEYNQLHKNIYDVWDSEKDINEDVEMYRTSGNNAWVNIMYGCNNFCTYCIVPYVRGRERSRAMSDIIAEVKSLVNEGYSCVTLLGQNVNSYGNDLSDPNVNFANLLHELCKIEGDFKIKFMTSHPKDLTEDVINEIATQDKLAKYIHLPIQSGSNRILHLMNRKYTKEQYLKLIDMIRSKMPDCAISTDIIVGFPDESEDDFNETYELVKSVRYDGVFAFMYSPRTGTVAEKMENQIPEEIKNERVNKLLKLSKAITKEKTKECVGKILDVLVENIDDVAHCLTDSGRTVVVENIDGLTENHYYKAQITKYLDNTLYAEIMR